MHLPWQAARGAHGRGAESWPSRALGLRTLVLRRRSVRLSGRLPTRLSGRGTPRPPHRVSPRRALQERKAFLEVICRADHLERFLGAKFPAVKRFGLEGAEAVIAGLHALVERAALLGVEGVELGMAHRGRLNVLANVFDKPLGAICNESTPTLNPPHCAPAAPADVRVRETCRFHEGDELMGDVKYHLGTYSQARARPARRAGSRRRLRGPR